MAPAPTHGQSTDHGATDHGGPAVPVALVAMWELRRLGAVRDTKEGASWVAL